VRAVAEEPLKQGALLLVLADTVLLVVCLCIGEKRWRAAGLDLDDRRPLD